MIRRFLTLVLLAKGYPLIINYKSLGLMSKKLEAKKKKDDDIAEEEDRHYHQNTLSKPKN